MLLGTAAMLLSFEIVPEAIAEHDEWHSHEHLPERLSIPGFLRGTRWVALRGAPRYFVLYEVASVATLTSAAYLERLNHPTPWTTKMMRHYRDMNRGLCSVSGGAGAGIGHFARLIRFSPSEGARDPLLQSLRGLPAKRGVCSAHLLERAASAPMTNEQRIRGADAGMDAAILVTGYEEAAVAELANPLAPGTSNVRDAVYRAAHTLSSRELA
jgi:hypothetical protein